MDKWVKFPFNLPEMPSYVHHSSQLAAVSVIKREKKSIKKSCWHWVQWKLWILFAIEIIFMALVFSRWIYGRLSLNRYQFTVFIRGKLQHIVKLISLKRCNLMVCIDFSLYFATNEIGSIHCDSISHAKCSTFADKRKRGKQGFRFEGEDLVST